MARLLMQDTKLRLNLFVQSFGHTTRSRVNLFVQSGQAATDNLFVQPGQRLRLKLLVQARPALNLFVQPGQAARSAPNELVQEIAAAGLVQTPFLQLVEQPVASSTPVTMTAANANSVFIILLFGLFLPAQRGRMFAS